MLKPKTQDLVKAGQVIYYDSVHDGKAVRIARDFLVEMICQLSKQASAYFRSDGENHFLRFSERNLYSQLAVSINRLTNLHVSEEGVERSSRKSSGSGRVDFWAYYRKTNILLEVKRNYFSLNNGPNINRVSRSLESLLQQTRSLKNEAKGWEGKSALIGLQVLLPYMESKSKIGLKKRINNLCKESDYTALAAQFRTDLMPPDSTQNSRISKPDFVATWIPPKDMLFFEDDLDHFEYHPFCGFAAYLFTLT